MTGILGEDPVKSEANTPTRQGNRALQATLGAWRSEASRKTSFFPHLDTGVLAPEPWEALVPLFLATQNSGRERTQKPRKTFR